MAQAHDKLLQQYLPFTVLKLTNLFSFCFIFELQQYLPFTVLKLNGYKSIFHSNLISCNSTYRLRYWNVILWRLNKNLFVSCNSTYRLRYWNFSTFFEPVRYCFGCNSTYRLRYWNGLRYERNHIQNHLRCNSTYRLRYWNWSPKSLSTSFARLQQYLPFTVLKHLCIMFANAKDSFCCNSTYRLRYWNSICKNN